MLIREAQKEDALQLIEYVKKVADETKFLTFSSDEFNKTQEEEAAIIEAHRLAPNQTFLIAEINGKIAGILNVSANKKKRLRHIGEFGVSVLKEHWNQGIGKALVNYMINWAKENRIIRKINLKVQVDNAPAIHLYHQLGFEQEGLVRRDLLVDKQFHDTYIMGLLID